MEPDLLQLQGRVDHEEVEAALDAVVAGAFPGWSVTYDDMAIEMLRTSTGDSSVGGLAGGLNAVSATLTRSGGQVPARVWIIVLEQRATSRSEVLKFQLVSGDGEEPVWVRIRPDASTPMATERAQG